MESNDYQLEQQRLRKDDVIIEMAGSLANAVIEGHVERREVEAGYVTNDNPDNPPINMMMRAYKTATVRGVKATSIGGPWRAVQSLALDFVDMWADLNEHAYDAGCTHCINPDPMA